MSVKELSVTEFFFSYLEIVKSEGLEISQPALDRNSTEIHHKITLRSKTKKFHRFKSTSIGESFSLCLFSKCLALNVQHDVMNTGEFTSIEALRNVLILVKILLAQGNGLVGDRIISVNY